MSMLNFNFQNPTRIVFGKGQITQLSTLVPRDKKILMCYGHGSIKRNGVYDQVMSALKGYDITEFSGIEANPEYETLLKAVMFLKEHGPENYFILAVGGGSIVDGCKFICLAALYNKSTDYYQDIMVEGAVKCEAALPLGVVLTLPATGSESNHAFVVSYRAKHLKYGVLTPLIFPKFAVMDPVTSYTLPYRQTANGIVDAFVHVCEQYLIDCRHADVQDRYSEALLKVLYENGKKIREDPNNYDIRANIMWAANQALNHWLGQGVRSDWSTHNIGHELTVYLGLDHGQTLAIIQPRLLKHKFNTKRGKLAQMAERVFGVTTGTEEEKALKCIELIEHFYSQEVGVPTHIHEYDCSQDKAWIDDMHAKLTACDAKFGEDMDIVPDVIREIILNSY